MNTPVLPDLQAAVLCEDVRAEHSGQQTLVGVLGVIPTSTLPIGFFKLCLWTRWCGGVGSFSQRTTNMNAHATNVHFFAGIQFKRFGIYHVEVHLDDELKMRIPLPVVQMQEEK
jgi:hypothetical protein